MTRWRVSLFIAFVVLGLFVDRLLIKPALPQPATLAEVTNWATIATPTPTPKVQPSTTPSPTPSVTTKPSPTPTKALSPTLKTTPTSTLSPTPTPRVILTSTLTPSPPIAPTPKPTTEPEHYFTYSLFGYTSSYANVRLEGVKLLEGTKANQNGYFEFVNFKASSYNQEFCLLSIDTENLITPPVCIPVPKTQTEQKYGPYLLPPTLKLAKGEIKTNETERISGKTIPGTRVNIYVFNQPGQSLAKLILPPVLAQSPTATQPLQQLTSNNDGSFSFNLKAEQSGKKRVFAQAVYSFNRQSNKTPKSTTLTLNILSTLVAILLQLLLALRKLFSLNAILLLQLCLIALLIAKRKQIFSWYYLAKQKQTAIILYRQQALTKAVKNYCPLDQKLLN